MMENNNQPKGRKPDSKTGEKKSSVTIIVNGGTNQILPNATHATQMFYGGKHVTDSFTDDDGLSFDFDMDGLDDLSSADESSLSAYFFDEELLNRYVQRIGVCCSARDLARVLVDMVSDPSVSIDREQVVKRSFLEVVLSMAPRIATGVDNLRYSVNDVLSRKNQRRRS